MAALISKWHHLTGLTDADYLREVMCNPKEKLSTLASSRMPVSTYTPARVTPYPAPTAAEVAATTALRKEKETLSAARELQRQQKNEGREASIREVRAIFPEATSGRAMNSGTPTERLEELLHKIDFHREKFGYGNHSDYQYHLRGEAENWDIFRHQELLKLARAAALDKEDADENLAALKTRQEQEKRELNATAFSDSESLSVEVELALIGQAEVACSGLTRW